MLFSRHTFIIIITYFETRSLYSALSVLSSLLETRLAFHTLGVCLQPSRTFFQVQSGPKLLLLPLITHPDAASPPLLPTFPAHPVSPTALFLRALVLRAPPPSPRHSVLPQPIFPSRPARRRRGRPSLLGASHPSARPQHLGPGGRYLQAAQLLSALAKIRALPVPLVLELLVHAGRRLQDAARRGRRPRARDAGRPVHRGRHLP